MTEWNPTAYTRLANYMQSWGEAIVDGLPLDGNETVLDLGCGDGRLTEHLVRRLPTGTVIAIDRSQNMLDAARQHLEPEFGQRVQYRQLSLDELDYDQVAELAFSNAALHWIPDHSKMFRAIFRALKPGGWLIAQCGGGPNILRVRQRAQQLMDQEPYQPYFEGWNGPWEFASEELTRERLAEAGFLKIDTSTFEVPMVRSDRQEARDYLENVILGSHLARIPKAEERSVFLDVLADQYALDEPPFAFDYWRLNIRARRPE